MSGNSSGSVVDKNPRLKDLLLLLKPALEASLDPVCLVNTQNQVVYLNMLMKSVLGLKGREIHNGAIFCDSIKLAPCERNCQVLKAIASGEPLRLDEVPAIRALEKVRVAVKIVPLFDPTDASKNRQSLGAIISLRDTTGEVLLQAKYHKLMQINGEKDIKIHELMERVEALRNSLRKERDEAA